MKYNQNQMQSLQEYAIEKLVQDLAKNWQHLKFILESPFKNSVKNVIIQSYSRFIMMTSHKFCGGIRFCEPQRRSILHAFAVAEHAQIKMIAHIKSQESKQAQGFDIGTWRKIRYYKCKTKFIV
jgi:hypothetical protein